MAWYNFFFFSLTLKLYCVLKVLQKWRFISVIWNISVFAVQSIFLKFFFFFKKILNYRVSLGNFKFQTFLLPTKQGLLDRQLCLRSRPTDGRRADAVPLSLGTLDERAGSASKYLSQSVAVDLRLVKTIPRRQNKDLTNGYL